MVAFDTRSPTSRRCSHDPVDVLFGVQLGGGTDIARRSATASGWSPGPRDTVLVLVSDLFEGGDAGVLRARVAELVRAGVTVLVLLALVRRGRAGPRPRTRPTWPPSAPP